MENLIYRWQTWVTLPGIAALWIIFDKVVMPGLRRWHIRQLQLEDANLVQMLITIFTRKHNAPLVKEHIESVLQPLFDADYRWRTNLEERLSDMESNISEVSQTAGTAITRLDDHQDTIDLLRNFIPTHQTLMKTQIDQYKELNLTMKSLQQAIGDHNSEIGELRGILSTLKSS